MNEQSLSNVADAYEAMIDWPKRLAREEPFFRWIFEQTKAQSVLDVACGTGHHVNLFRSWGLRVEGADLSEAMISRCQTQWGQSDSHRWNIRRFDQPVDTPASFDVAICTGNSLALVESQEDVTRTITHLLGAVREGGAVVLHVRNLWSLPQGTPLWQKCKRTLLPQGDSLIIKGLHRCGAQGFINLLITDLSKDPPALSSTCVPFMGFEKADLEMLALRCGAKTVTAFGNYAREEYARETSEDLILAIAK